MTGAPFYRVAWVLLGYAGAAWVVLGVSGWFRRALALPALFETLLRGGLLMGVPIAVLAAWYYPRLGLGDSARDDLDASGG